MIATMDQTANSRDAKRATYVAAWLDGLLGCAKVAVGSLVGSAALVADGIHSFSDLITDGFVLVATHYGRQGPDHDHHYGHGRIETLATLLLGSVLIFVAGAIAWSSLQRLLAGTEIAAPGVWAMLLTLMALLTKEALFHYTMRVAKQVQSKLLEANAWHSRSDVLSTAVVLIALVGAQYGAGWLDAVAAVIVGLLVGKVGWDLLWESARELVDTALPADAQQTMHEVACAVPGVESVHDLRTRQSAGWVMVDLHIVVGPMVSVSEAHEIGNEVSRRLRRAFPALTDVTFHIDPEDDAGEGDPSRFPGLPLRPEVTSALDARWNHHPAWRNLTDLQLHYLDGKVSVALIISDTIHQPPQCLASQLKAQASDIEWLGHVEVLFVTRAASAMR
ncbi:cation transporter [Billgrantia tianxiuensis]|jgi:cation diffusion facilitator family transporter|uniref:Cation transporter n=1 Tax=Billgrantia tianxiuensis TaxID=2497861 RepID=A0A6I6SPU0_9GAMM|nr:MULTISPECIES: cation diffusion facilitator family transporter [Halomonas]MCE8035253.1 cation transporter [Halomonas sp. MCCC 1A11057]QHC51932.1 cation transporter [Halomonas tianxiuensis]